MDIKYDVTLKAIVTKWDGNGLTGTQLEVAAIECILHHQNGAKWTLPTPKLLSLFIKNTRDLSPAKRADLLTPGAHVRLHIKSTVDDYEVEVVSAQVFKSTPALEFIHLLDNVQTVL